MNTYPNCWGGETVKERNGAKQQLKVIWVKSWALQKFNNFLHNLLLII